MNIFYLHSEPVLCAQYHVDKHVVKMIVEYAQLLSTAHRLLDGKEVVLNNRKRWQLADERDTVLYQATHKQHPSALWTRASRENYLWLYQLFLAVLDEYSYRYEKTHATARLSAALKHAPDNCPDLAFTEPTPAMPEHYRVAGDSVQSYRNYYLGSKTALFAWKKRGKPDWIHDVTH